MGEEERLEKLFQLSQVKKNRCGGPVPISKSEPAWGRPDALRAAKRSGIENAVKGLLPAGNPEWEEGEASHCCKGKDAEGLPAPGYKHPKGREKNLAIHRESGKNEEGQKKEKSREKGCSRLGRGDRGRNGESRRRKGREVRMVWKKVLACGRGVRTSCSRT